MKKLAIVQQVAVILLLNFLLYSCDSTEKDWKNAQMTNSIAEYQKFINNHSRSVYAQNAQNLVDSLEWVTVLKSYNVDSLQQFIISHSSSIFLSSSKVAMDSIEWNIAYYSRDTVQLRKYSEKFPSTENSTKAKQLIWEIQWPPVKFDKAASVIIYSKGIGIIHGQIMYSTAGMFGDGGGMDPTPVEPAVYIWRDFSKDEISSFAKLGLRPGYSYLMPERRKFKLIRKIDLNKSDNELLSEFGVGIK